MRYATKSCRKAPKQPCRPRSEAAERSGALIGLGVGVRSSNANRNGANTTSTADDPFFDDNAAYEVGL